MYNKFLILFTTIITMVSNHSEASVSITFEPNRYIVDCDGQEHIFDNNTEFSTYISNNNDLGQYFGATSVIKSNQNNNNTIIFYDIYSCNNKCELSFCGNQQYTPTLVFYLNRMFNFHTLHFKYIPECILSMPLREANFDINMEHVYASGRSTRLYIDNGRRKIKYGVVYSNENLDNNTNTKETNQDDK
ncbi:MAG: hypothetical protein IJ848_00245 [Alphaproteobacteria bacterium]|nr:hypothetical protein [Alphaproteobacteria bacterium]